MSNEQLIIGLTGGIGSGKTAASDFFQSQGIWVVDADIAARTVVASGSELLAEIQKHFGDDALLPDGTLNRGWLRQQIFEQPEQRQWLEALTHPAIRRQIIAELARADSAYSILVSPLLFESGQDKLTTRTLLIDAPEALQLQRTTRRDNNSNDQVSAIIAAQMPRTERLQRSDDVIVNDLGFDHLHRECLKYHQRYIALSGSA